jgi:hypothetical protein
VDATPPPGYRTQSEDTSYAAERLLFERWAAMSLHEKAMLVDQASRDLHELCVAGLRHRMPEASDYELEIRAMALKYGAELVRRPVGIDVPPEDVRFG